MPAILALQVQTYLGSLFCFQLRLFWPAFFPSFCHPLLTMGCEAEAIPETIEEPMEAIHEEPIIQDPTAEPDTVPMETEAMATLQQSK
ncbi:unnamed protein product [Symbiodinium microadriaticum]|nr:unnamed protein product [Symbiodinium microadriaticum]